MNKSKKKKPFAKKSLGQNFLVDQNYIDKIISSLNLQKDETVVEIGAGRGALTEKLVERARKVLAIEIDRELIPGLRVMFLNDKNFALIEQDALEIDFQSLINLQGIPRKTKLVANLPYNISTAILQHLIKYRHCFSEMVLMLQKEVVDRITAETGNKDRGFLTVLIEAYFDNQKLFDVPGKAFRPVPKVMSSVVRLITKKDSAIENIDADIFRNLVSVGFMQKRKTIQNNLKNAQTDIKDRIEKVGGISKIFLESKIDPKRRAETLALEEWIDLTRIVTNTEKNEGQNGETR